MKSFGFKSLCVVLAYLMTLLSFAAAVNQPEQPPPTDASPTLQLQIRVINLQGPAVNNKTISQAQLQNLGNTGVAMSNQAEQDAVTAAFDTWVTENYSVLLAQFPDKKAELDYIVQYGIHYVLLTAASDVASGSSINSSMNVTPHLTYATYNRAKRPHLTYADYGYARPHFLRVVSARCYTAGVMGSALGLVGAIGSYYGEAALGAVLFGFAGAAGVVGAALLLGVAIYCIT